MVHRDKADNMSIRGADGLQSILRRRSELQNVTSGNERYEFYGVLIGIQV